MSSATIQQSRSWRIRGSKFVNRRLVNVEMLIEAIDLYKAKAIARKVKVHVESVTLKEELSRP